MNEWVNKPGEGASSSSLWRYISAHLILLLAWYLTSNQSEMDHEGKLRKSQGPAPVPRLRIIICNLKFPASDRNEVILTPMAEMSPQLLMQDLQSSVRSLPSITGSPKGTSHTEPWKSALLLRDVSALSGDLRESPSTNSSTWRPSVLSTVLWASLPIYQCPLNTRSGPAFMTTWDDSHHSSTWNQAWSPRSQGGNACDPSLKASYTNIVPSPSASSPLPTDWDKAVFCPPALPFPETSCGPNILCADPLPPQTNELPVHRQRDSQFKVLS